eukprot:136579_1
MGMLGPMLGADSAPGQNEELPTGSPDQKCPMEVPSTVWRRIGGDPTLCPNQQPGAHCPAVCKPDHWADPKSTGSLVCINGSWVARTRCYPITPAKCGVPVSIRPGIPYLIRVRIPKGGEARLSVLASLAGRSAANASAIANLFDMQKRPLANATHQFKSVGALTRIDLGGAVPRQAGDYVVHFQLLQPTGWLAAVAGGGSGGKLVVDCGNGVNVTDKTTVHESALSIKRHYSWAIKQKRARASIPFKMT